MRTQRGLPATAPSVAARRRSAGLGLLSLAFVLRLLLVPLAWFLPQLTGQSARLAALAPLPVTFLTMLGFLLVLRRGDEARSALWAQLSAALLSTELLFDCLIATAPQRLAGFEQLPYLVDVLWLAILLASWAALRAITTERGASLPTALNALFYFAVAVRAGMYLQRALSHRTIDIHRTDALGATALLVTLAIPLFELLATGVARRAGKAAPISA